jgi:hypothetical protein
MALPALAIIGMHQQSTGCAPSSLPRQHGVVVKDARNAGVARLDGSALLDDLCLSARRKIRAILSAVGIVEPLALHGDK